MDPSSASARLVQLEGYLRQDPGNTALRANTVMAAVECGATERAEQWLASSPVAASAPIEHARGVLRLAQHRYAEAAKSFESLLAAGVASAAVRFNLAYALFGQGDHAQAAQQFEGLLAEQDAPAETLGWLLRCFHHAGDPARAVAAWRAAPDRFKTPQASAVASLACLDDDQIDDARHLSDAALRESPAPLEALVVRATLAVGDGDSLTATRLLDEALAQGPRDGRVWSAWAAAQLLLSNVQAAQEGFQRAAQYLPSHVGTWVALAWCQILRRELQGARASLETALAFDRNFAETHGGLAVVAALEGREDEARQAIERALRLDKTSASAHYARAVIAGLTTDPAAVHALARRLLGVKGNGIALLERALNCAGRTRR